MCGMIYIETLEDVREYRARFAAAGIPAPEWLDDSERQLTAMDTGVPDTFPAEWERKETYLIKKYDDAVVVHAGYREYAVIA